MKKNNEFRVSVSSFLELTGIAFCLVWLSACGQPPQNTKNFYSAGDKVYAVSGNARGSQGVIIKMYDDSEKDPCVGHKYSAFIQIERVDDTSANGLWIPVNLCHEDLTVL